MGQKVNPIGLRLGIIKSWESRWFSEKDYSKLLQEDIDIRKFLMKKLSSAGISKVVPQNEDAFSYLVEETLLTVFQDGSTVLFDERLGDFISDAEHAHLCCAYV